MVTVRPATEADRAFILAMRNDPEVIRLSRRKTRVSGEWFSAVKTRLHVISEDHALVGYAIITPLPEVSIVLTKKARGHGLGSRAIRILTAFRKESLARIQRTNLASIKAFQKAGFDELHEYRSLYKSPR